MIIVLVNNQQIQFLQPIEEVLSLTIVHHPFPMPIPQHLTRPIAEWVYDLSQRAQNQILYNGVILTKDQVKNPKDFL